MNWFDGERSSTSKLAGKKATLPQIALLLITNPFCAHTHVLNPHTQRGIYHDVHDHETGLTRREIPPLSLSSSRRAFRPEIGVTGRFCSSHYCYGGVNSIWPHKTDTEKEMCIKWKIRLWVKVVLEKILKIQSNFIVSIKNSIIPNFTKAL